MALEERLRTQISELIDNNRVVLFMKGTRSFPQCGFSATVVQILDDLVPEYHTVNVLKEPDIREGIKAVLELADHPAALRRREVRRRLRHRARDVRVGRAAERARRAGAQSRRRRASWLTEAARQAVQQAGEARRACCGSSVSSRFEYELSLDEQRKGDFEIDAGGGLKLVIDRMSAKRADGISIDYSSASGGGFRIDNPNEPARVQPLQPAELKALLEQRRAARAVDVRTRAGIRHRAHRGRRAARRRGRAGSSKRSTSDTPLVFYCHHGMRSRAAAERFVAEGFKRVFNLEGGIDAWSQAGRPLRPPLLGSRAAEPFRRVGHSVIRPTELVFGGAHASLLLGRARRRSALSSVALAQPAPARCRRPAPRAAAHPRRLHPRRAGARSRADALSRPRASARSSSRASLAPAAPPSEPRRRSRAKPPSEMDPHPIDSVRYVPEKGFEMRTEDKLFSLTIGAWLQVRSTWRGIFDRPDRFDVEIPSARVIFSGNIWGEDIRYLLELGLSPRSSRPRARSRSTAWRPNRDALRQGPLLNAYVEFKQLSDLDCASASSRCRSADSRSRPRPSSRPPIARSSTPPSPSAATSASTCTRTTSSA